MTRSMFRGDRDMVDMATGPPSSNGTNTWSAPSGASALPPSSIRSSPPIVVNENVSDEHNLSVNANGQQDNSHEVGITSSNQDLLDFEGTSYPDNAIYETQSNASRRSTESARKRRQLEAKMELHRKAAERIAQEELYAKTKLELVQLESADNTAEESEAETVTQHPVIHRIHVEQWMQTHSVPAPGSTSRTPFQTAVPGRERGALQGRDPNRLHSSQNVRFEQDRINPSFQLSGQGPSQDFRSQINNQSRSQFEIPNFSNRNVNVNNNNQRSQPHGSQPHGSQQYNENNTQQSAFGREHAHSGTFPRDNTYRSDSGGREQPSVDYSSDELDNAPRRSVNIARNPKKSYYTDSEEEEEVHNPRSLGARPRSAAKSIDEALSSTSDSDSEYERFKVFTTIGVVRSRGIMLLYRPLDVTYICSEAQDLRFDLSFGAGLSDTITITLKTLPDLDYLCDVDISTDRANKLVVVIRFPTAIGFNCDHNPEAFYVMKYDSRFAICDEAELTVQNVFSNYWTVFTQGRFRFQFRSNASINSDIEAHAYEVTATTARLRDQSKKSCSKVNETECWDPVDDEYYCMTSGVVCDGIKNCGTVNWNDERMSDCDRPAQTIGFLPIIAVMSVLICALVALAHLLRQCLPQGKSFFIFHSDEVNKFCIDPVFKETNIGSYEQSENFRRKKSLVPLNWDDSDDIDSEDDEVPILFNSALSLAKIIPDVPEADSESERPPSPRKSKQAESLTISQRISRRIKSVVHYTPKASQEEERSQPLTPSVGDRQDPSHIQKRPMRPPY
ncbi:hypothetical protein O0L34_g16637 [Tuta absoluta]|nr:hypothetical protein O0L34_g16637 [Tuta absoluta]